MAKAKTDVPGPEWRFQKENIMAVALLSEKQVFEFSMFP